MGVAGAAIATVIGQWTAMIMAFSFMLRKTNELNFKFKGFRPKKETILKFIVSVFLNNYTIIGSVMTVGMNTILISFSATAVAVLVYF